MIDEHRDLVALEARVFELERENADARDEVAALSKLQRSFEHMAAAKRPDDIIATMLHATRDPLGFSRAIFFSTDRIANIEAQFELDAGDEVERSFEPADLRIGSSFLTMLRDRESLAVGRAGELSAPLVDVRRWYVASTFDRGPDVGGILYVDGHRSKRMKARHAELIRALTTISAAMHERAERFERTRVLAERDPLTGLLNRRAFNEQFEYALAGAVTAQKRLTYVLIDVDDFKAINDSHGHAAGDAVLRAIADTLSRHSRSNDIVGRFAGDEFNLVLNTIDADVADTLVARLSRALRQQHLACSLGAARYPADGTDVNTLFERADTALYVAKRAGKNTFRFFSHDISLGKTSEAFNNRERT